MAVKQTTGPCELVHSKLFRIEMFQMIIKKYHSEGRPREIAIKAPTPGTRMHPTAIPSLIRHPNHTDKDCAKMIYSQTPNKFRVEAVKHYKGCDRLPGHEEPHKLRGSMKKSAKLPKYSYLGYIKSPLISTTAPAFTVSLKLTKSTYCDLEEARHQ